MKIFIKVKRESDNETILLDVDTICVLTPIGQSKAFIDFGAEETLRVKETVNSISRRLETSIRHHEIQHLEGRQFIDKEEMDAITETLSNLYWALNASVDSSSTGSTLKKYDKNP